VSTIPHASPRLALASLTLTCFFYFVVTLHAFKFLQVKQLLLWIGLSLK